MKDKVLILNPGSTSTKIAVYCNDEIIHLFHVTQSTMNTTTAAINHSKQNEKDTNHSIPPK